MRPTCLRVLYIPYYKGAKKQLHLYMQALLSIALSAGQLCSARVRDSKRACLLAPLLFKDVEYPPSLNIGSLSSKFARSRFG